MHFKATQLHSTQAQKIHSSSTCLWHVRCHLCLFSVSTKYSVICHTQNSKYISWEKVGWVKWGHRILQTNRRKALNRHFHYLNVKLWQLTWHHNKHSVDTGTIYEHYLQVRIEIKYIIRNQSLHTFFHRNFTLWQETFLTIPLHRQSCFITVIYAKIQQALILNTHIQHCSAIVQRQVITITNQKRTPIMHSRLAITNITSLVLYP